MCSLQSFWVSHRCPQRSTLGVVTARVRYVPSGSLTSHRIKLWRVVRRDLRFLSSLSEKTRKSNHLQMSLQRKHFLLSYLKTLSVGPAKAWTHDLPHGSQALYQLSQPVGGIVILLNRHNIYIIWWSTSVGVCCSLVFTKKNNWKENPLIDQFWTNTILFFLSTGVLWPAWHDPYPVHLWLRP